MAEHAEDRMGDGTEAASAGEPHDGHDHNRAHQQDEMRQVDQVRRNILDRVRPLAAIELPLQESWGCVLAEDMVAEADIPAFASSAMDGFAVRAADVAAALVDDPVTLRVVGQVPVGQQPEVTVGGGEAARIATGAPVPAGADCVVPIEHCVIQGGEVLVLAAFAEGRNVRPTGQDIRTGEVLVP